MTDDDAFYELEELIREGLAECGEFNIREIDDAGETIRVFRIPDGTARPRGRLSKRQLVTSSVPFLIINRHGDPGSPHATREECFEIIDGMVHDGIAEQCEFWVVERGEHGGVIGEPFSRSSELEHPKTPAS